MLIVIAFDDASAPRSAALAESVCVQQAAAQCAASVSARRGGRARASRECGSVRKTYTVRAMALRAVRSRR